MRRMMSSACFARLSARNSGLMTVMGEEFSVELPTNSQPDISQLAQIVEQLERAGAVSTQTKVDILHPDWSEEQRAEEVERIRAENGMNAQANMNRILEEQTPPEEDEE